MDAHAVQDNPGQSRTLACLTCLSGLLSAGTTLYLRGSGEQQPQQLTPPASIDVGHCRQGGKRSQVSQFPVPAGSYLPEKSQAKDSAISFPTQGNGREWRIPPTPLLHLQWAVDLPFLTGKVVYYWVVRKSLESSVTGMNCQRVGCEEILKRWLLGRSSHYVFVLVPRVLFKNF